MTPSPTPTPTPAPAPAPAPAPTPTLRFNDTPITVPVCKLPRGKKLLGQANKTTSKSGHKRRSGTFCRGRNLDHMAGHWSTIKVTFVLDGR